MKTNQLVVVRGREAVTTSLKIAKSFGKKHKEILKTIESLDCSDLFREMNLEYTFDLRKGEGQKRRSGDALCYITRNGFALLSAAFTGTEATEIKEEYLSAFEEEYYNRLLSESVYFELRYLDIQSRLKIHQEQVALWDQCLASGSLLEGDLPRIAERINL